MIQGAKGEVPVEDIRPGDLVQTFDNGLQPVAWITKRRVGAAELALRPNLRPVLIQAGAFGIDRKLVVSPQHGLLLQMESRQRFVRARHLARLRGGAVRVMSGCRNIIYVHIGFERHEVVFANSRPAESFFPGPMALRSLDAGTRDAFFARLPDALRRSRRSTLDEDHWVMRDLDGWSAARDFWRYNDLPSKLATLDFVRA